MEELSLFNMADPYGTARACQLRGFLLVDRCPDVETRHALTNKQLGGEMNFRRRFFSNSERSALFMVAGGKCESCGTDLLAGWHADHTKPWSRRGKTVVGNGQALCAMCNLVKGDTEMITFESLRAWQKRFVRDFSNEIHHVGEEAAWGIGLQESFEGASRRLALSGTPWRSDGVPMPFLRVDLETGQYEYNYCFDWPAALEEEPPSIRLLAFRADHGSAEYEHDGQVIRLSSRDPLSDEHAARCLRGRLLETALCLHVLRDAHAKLMELRESKPDAGGLVVCMDIGHAKT
jgi:HNH endonuclease